MTIAAMGVTKPAAGVIATRPATAPEAAPSTVGLPRELHSVNIQASAAAAVAVFVVMKALAARPFAASALPALNPNQPNQSRLAPITRHRQVVRRHGLVTIALCACPMTSAAASAETPEEMCTTVPPAKSSAPRFAEPAADAPDPVRERVVDEAWPRAG